MNRRTFLATSLAAPVVAAVGPRILGATDKAGSQTPRLGRGEHTYEWHQVFAELPNGLEWQTTHNVAVDAAGLVYVSHQGIGKKVDTVYVFEPAGKFVRSFGKAWHGGGHGLDIRKEGGEEFVYLTNTSASPKVVKATLKGEVVWAKERPEVPEYADKARRYTPTNIAFHPDGGFTVADGYGSNYCLQYDAKGEFVRLFGGTGESDGQFRTPHGLWTDSRSGTPKLVVCDRANARLQTFSLDGKHESTSPVGATLFPANIDTRGDVMLVADLHARVSLFGPGSEVIAHLGDDPAWRAKVLGDKMSLRTKPNEWVAGKFTHPHDACFDAAGNIYVTEWVAGGRVVFLKKVG